MNLQPLDRIEQMVAALRPVSGDAAAANASDAAAGEASMDLNAAIREGFTKADVYARLASVKLNDAEEAIRLAGLALAGGHSLGEDRHIVGLYEHMKVPYALPSEFVAADYRHCGR